MLADDAFPSLAAGREGLKQAFRMFRDATPGRREIEDQQISNDPQPRPRWISRPQFQQAPGALQPLAKGTRTSPHRNRLSSTALAALTTYWPDLLPRKGRSR
jgi:hypothetical protein